MHYSNNELLAIVGLPAADPLVRQVLADWHIFPNKQTVEGLTFTVDQCGGDGWQGCHKPVRRNLDGKSAALLSFSWGW